MPFENHGTRAFTAASVQNNAPTLSGVYGLSNARGWIYVGECSNIQEQLLEHLQEIGSFLKKQNPTGFTFELCLPASRIARQNRLILELEPVCNRSRERLSAET